MKSMVMVAVVAMVVLQALTVKFNITIVDHLVLTQDLHSCHQVVI